MSSKKVISTAVTVALLMSIVGCVFPGKKDTTASNGAGPNPTPSQNIWTRDANNVYTDLRQESYSKAGKDFDPFLTSDGKRVIYASTRISPRSDIFIQNVGSKVIEQVTHTPNSNEKQPQISPDGKRVVYASDKSGKWNIYESSVHVRSSRELEIINNGRVNEQPSYSPDGKFITYATWLPRQGVWNIAIIDRQTQQERLCGPGMFPKFSPDGTKILFQRPRVRIPQWFSIWMLDLKTMKVSEILSDAEWACVTPNWSPDGKKIIFAAINKNIGNGGPYAGDDIYTISTRGTHLFRLTSNNAPDWNPIWGKDNRVYFISLRNGNQNIWSIKPRDIDEFHPDTVENASATTIDSSKPSL